jgi:predicted secreted Zn-dependent protease
MKFVIALIAFTCLMAKADVVINEQLVYYTVSPPSKTLLLASLKKSSPITKNGKTFHGKTAYEIKWQFKWKNNRNMCTLTEVTTYLNLTYTMPKLRSSPLDVQEVWSTWYPNLELHDKGHGQLAIETAKEIDHKLIALGSFTSCSKLEQVANFIGNKLMNELNDATKNYDKITNHGESQNAWLYQHL